MIRKTLILGVFVLIALAAAAPALTGLYLAREFDDVVAHFERPGVLRVVSSRFNRGWFSSQASIRVRLDDNLCAHKPCPAVTLHSVIHHGPIPFTAPVAPGESLQPALGVAVTHIDAAPLWPRLVFEPALAPLRLTTRVGFDGQAATTVHLDGASVEVSRERALAHINMSTLSGHAAVPLNGRTVDAALDWPQFKIVGESGGQLAWRGLHASTHDPGADADTAAGQQLRAESVSLGDGLGTSARLQGLVWQLQPLPAPMSARFDARVSRLLFDNNEYGPLHVQGSLHHIDAADWAALRTRLATLHDERTGALNPAARAALYRNTLPQLLAGHPRIDVERIVLSTPDGDIRGHLRVGAPLQPRPARLLADVISQLDLDFQGQLPAPLARDLAAQLMLANGHSPYAISDEEVDRALAEMVDRGLVETVNDGHAYRLRLRMEHGRLTLNGRSQPGWQSVVDRFAAARERL